MTQTEKAKEIGMHQPRYSTWCRKIADKDYEAMLKGECFRVLGQEGLTIEVVKLKK